MAYYFTDMQEVVVLAVLHPPIVTLLASLMLLYQQITLYRPRSAYSSFAGVGTVPDWLPLVCFGLPVQGHAKKGEIHAEAWPPASTRRSRRRTPFHTM